MIDQAIHSIDLVLYMTGLKAVRVQGHTARRVLKTIEVEDEADAAITLKTERFIRSLHAITIPPTV